MIIAGICHKTGHGYWKGEECPKCKGGVKGEFKKEVFYTSKDKLWEFVDIMSTGKPVEIRTKGQWKRHLKAHGLHDDVPRWDKIPTEHKIEKTTKEERRKIAEGILQETLHELGRR
jgi:hypothetical protein